MSDFKKHSALRLFIGVVTATSICALSTTAHAQSRADKAAKIREQLEQLDDPDPLYRMLAFEEIMASDNRILKKMALDKAMDSGDKDLEEIAIPLLFSSFKSFTSEIIRPSKNTNSSSAGAQMAAQITPNGNLPSGYRASLETFLIGKFDSASTSGWGYSERYAGNYDDHADVRFRIQGSTLRITYSDDAKDTRCQMTYRHVGNATFVGHGECPYTKAASRITFR